MPDVVINSGKTGRLERQFDTEAEMLQAVIDWCVFNEQEVIGYVQIGAEDLFSFKAYSIYRVECIPDGEGDASLSITWLAADS